MALVSTTNCAYNEGLEAGSIFWGVHQKAGVSTGKNETHKEKKTLAKSVLTLLLLGQVDLSGDPFHSHIV